MYAPLGISSVLLAVYIANSPHLDKFKDSPAYELVASGLPRSFISSYRMPGYPILIAFSSMLSGGHDAGLIAVQAVLILAAVVATYFSARMALGHPWMAALVAALIAGDVLMAGYVRVEMTETLAVFLASILFLATLRYLKDFDQRYLWLMAVLLVGMVLTRPEWALLPLVLVPYLAVMARKRDLLTRRVLGHLAGSAAAVLIAVMGYSTANLVVNGYFGLSSISNIALLGKVMVYGMAEEAPARYAALVPIVESKSSAWDVVAVPPFDQPNSPLAGEFARAVILHDPLRFAQETMRTAIGSDTEYNVQFIRIDATGPFAHSLNLLLALDQRRYRAFAILPALALAWALAALIARRGDFRLQALGVLGSIVLYDWLITAAETFGEFGRVRMPINPIATVIVAGTFLLLVRLALSDRRRLIALAALVALEGAAIALLPRVTAALILEIALLAIAAVHLAVFVRWANPLVGDGLSNAPASAGT